jgi:hypothetical protein
MTSKEFIARCAEKIERGESINNKSCSSIFAHGDTIYSYGTHYPLLFRVQKLNGQKVWVVNDGGYSATTGKHVGWAISAMQYDVVCSPIGAMQYRTTIDISVAIDSINKEIEKIDSEMKTKKRKETQVYKWLQYRKDRAQNYLAMLN